jgi:hypothetical protein
VSGVAAMMLDENSALTPAQVHEQVVDTATNTPISSAGTGSPTRILFNGYTVPVEAPPETSTTTTTSTTTSTTVVAQEDTTTSTTSTTSSTAVSTSTTTAAPPPAASAPSEPDPEPQPDPEPVPTATTTTSTTTTTLAPAIATPVLASKKLVTRNAIASCKKIGSTKTVAKSTYRCVKVKKIAMWQPVNKKVFALRK